MFVIRKYLKLKNFKNDMFRSGSNVSNVSK